MASKPVNLPTELHEQIIDELVEPSSNDGSWKSRKALRCCLFVSQAFRLRARRHLFRDIELHDVDGQVYLRKRFVLLRELLEVPANGRDGGLLSNIRKFSIFFAFEDTDEGAGGEKGGKIISRVIEEFMPGVLISLFRKAHRLRHLLIEDISNSGCSWDLFSFDLDLGFRCLLRSRSLKHLELQNFTEVPNDLFDCTNITHLTTSGLYAMDMELEFEESTPIRSFFGTEFIFPPLQFLDTDQCFPLQRIIDISLNRTSVPARTSLLKNIKLLISDAFDLIKAVHLLRAAYLAEELFLDVTLEHQDIGSVPTMSLDLFPLQKLTRLTMWHHENWNVALLDFGPRSVERVYTLLKHTSPSIVFLTLGFAFSPSTPGNFKYQPKQEHWKSLDDLLSSTSFPLLQHLDLRIDLGIRWPPPTDLQAALKESTTRFEAALPRLFASDRLKIHID